MTKIKKYIMFVVAIGILFMGNQQVKAAETYQETEPNDIIAQAELITRNAQTAAQIAAGDLSGKYGVRGSLNDKDDIDWYRVTLYSNQDNIWDFAFTNSSSGSARLEVYDSNGDLVGNNLFVYSPNTTDRVFRVIVPTTSVYYLKISNISLDSSLFYGFSIGSPIYLMSSYVRDFSSITLNANSSWINQIVLTNNTTIPKDAIAYKVVLDGGTLASTSTREIRCDLNSTWKVSSSTPWNLSLPVTTTYKLRQSWEVRYNAKNKATTFAPKITFNYVYPRMPKSEQY